MAPLARCWLLSKLSLLLLRLGLPARLKPSQSVSQSVGGGSQTSFGLRYYLTMAKTADDPAQSVSQPARPTWRAVCKRVCAAGLADCSGAERVPAAHRRLVQLERERPKPAAYQPSARIGSDRIGSIANLNRQAANGTSQATSPTDNVGSRLEPIFTYFASSLPVSRSNSGAEH